MKVSLIGNNSKLANAICKLSDLGKYNFKGISRKINNESSMENIEGSIFNYENISKLMIDTDKAIFLIGSSKAPYGMTSFSQILKINAFSLAFFILAIEKVGYTGDLIFTSTAHIYQLSKIKSESYKEEQLIVDNTLHTWVLNIKEYMMEEALKLLNNPQYETKILQGISNFINEHPLPLASIPSAENGYYYIYEISKLVAEEILEVYRNKVILRLSYCYGYTDNSNIIYEYINDYYNKRKLILSAETKNFVFYDDFVDIISYFLDRNIKDEPKEHKIINIVADHSISVDDIVNKFNQLENTQKLNLDYYIKEHKRRSLKYSSSLMKSMLKQLKNRNTVTFNEGFDQVLFRYIAENRLNLRIIKEYIGGSYARVYLAQKSNKEKVIFKIANGNGAENGNIKLKFEEKQIESSKKALKGSQWENSVPGVKGSFFSDTISYTLLDYIEGKSITELIFNDNISLNKINNMIVRIYHILMNTYLKDLIVSPKDFYSNNYSGRIIRRLRNISQYFSDSELGLFKYLDKYKRITINGHEYRNPINIIKDIESNGESKLLNVRMLGLCISGDPILDNIIDFNGDLHFIDPRGDVVWLNNRPYFDPLYDVGKIFFYFAGWKLIRFEEFQISYSDGHFVENSEYTIRLTGVFSNLFKQVQQSIVPILYGIERDSNYLNFEENYLVRLYFIIASHFLSDTYPRLVGKGKHKIDQVIAEYLIGTIILNKLYEHILLSKEISVEKMNYIGMWQDV